MDLISKLARALGPAHVLTGDDTAKYASDWTGTYVGAPLAVIRPANTGEVSAAVKMAAEAGVQIVPISGNTSLAGGTHGPGALMISMERMNRITEIRPAARIAIVEAGVVLSQLHDATAEHDLSFPLTFGARGSAMIGGALSTNAGGSNVLRYGNTRSLCLGLEVVLPSGEVLNLMSALHKDNSGYDLKDLFIGAEGTLGLITGAVLKLVPQPQAYATAMVATPCLDAALTLLNQLQQATGGAVEAFEYMPGEYMDATLAMFPEMRAPFDTRHDVNILVEVGATAARDAVPDGTGAVPIVTLLEQLLSGLFEDGAVLDATVAQSDLQRKQMWARREAAAEVSLGHGPVVNNDIAVPLDKVATFLDLAKTRLAPVAPDATILTVSHLGDGNVHYTVRPKDPQPEVINGIMETVEDIVLSLGGSFSAEHGIGLAKKPSMDRRKDPVALAVMRSIKAALDPDNRMNPGKVLP
ncbi:FAD-binding oxidoreductase [Actibacterium sp. 188UL27-1]|uniref:FAD-binding oxidoreductase n=1 Tax=Actibacterium sp. 188UL27-1 TaxID=2786961 RepID=UPI00195DF488|nr:FAD-binding oxidoreductase [Actibacterium sp. 188UL27-1]MBM7069474.1 FAD-binding oxidoreductase [Actibacterium sp. 188UL27-1]